MVGLNRLLSDDGGGGVCDGVEVDRDGGGVEVGKSVLYDQPTHVGQQTAVSR